MMVSIVTPLYNRNKLIAETISSVQAQTYTNWEHIIVDDGSTDGSQEVVKLFVKKDKRIRFFQRDRKPKGASTCRNFGIERCRGQYVVFLDSDDLLAKFCLKERLATMKEHTECDFWVFPMQFFYSSAGDLDRVWLKSTHDNYLSGFLSQVQWLITSPIWKKEALIQLGGFDESLLGWQDWDLHIRALIHNYKFEVFDVVSDCFCRRDDTERISKNQHKVQQLENRIGLFSKIYALLTDQQRLTRANRSLLIDKYLDTSLSLYNLDHRKKAFDSLKRAKRIGLLNNLNFYMAQLHLRMFANYSNRYANYVYRKIWSSLPGGIVWQLYNG